MICCARRRVSASRWVNLNMVMFSCTADGQKLTLKCLTFQFKTIIHLTRTFTFFARARRGSGFAARYNLYAWFANSPQLSLLFETKPTLFTLGFIACANLVARFSHSTIKILFRSDRRLSFAVYACGRQAHVAFSCCVFYLFATHCKQSAGQHLGWDQRILWRFDDHLSFGTQCRPESALAAAGTATALFSLCNFILYKQIKLNAPVWNRHARKAGLWCYFRQKRIQHFGRLIFGWNFSALRDDIRIIRASAFNLHRSGTFAAVGAACWSISVLNYSGARRQSLELLAVR